MAEIERKEEKRTFGEEAWSLLAIALGPLVWAIHFAISYASTAIFCAKVGSGASFALFRGGIGALTLVAVGLVAWLAWRSWRQWHDGPEETSDSEEGRHHFLGHAAFLLALISLCGIVYVSLPVLFIGSCI